MISGKDDSSLDVIPFEPCQPFDKPPRQFAARIVDQILERRLIGRDPVSVRLRGISPFPAGSKQIESGISSASEPVQIGLGLKSDFSFAKPV